MINRIVKKFNHLRRKRDLTTGSISKNIWILALPMIGINLFESGFNLVDMFWVGKLGPDALAAVAMAGNVIMLVFFILIGISTGTIAMVSRFIGAKNQEFANNVAWQSLVLGTFISIVFGGIGYFLAHPVLKILGAEPAVLVLGSGYLKILFSWVFVMVYLFFMSAILQGAGDAFIPMLVLGFSTLINLILDPFLIFGWGFFPKMGVEGAALSTVIARAAGSLLALEILFMGRSHIRIKFKKPDFEIMWRLIKIGMPASLQLILRGFMGIAMIAVVAGFGTYAVAAYGVGIRLIMIVMMPGFAFAAAAQTLVGQNLGAKMPERADRSAWTAFLYYLIFMISMSIIFFFFSDFFLRLFSSNLEVISVGAAFLKIVAFGFGFIAMALVFGRALSGSGDTISPLIITFVALWIIQIPLAVFLAYKTIIGLKGVWLAILIASILQGIITISWFQTGRWKTRRI